MTSGAYAFGYCARKLDVLIVKCVDSGLQTSDTTRDVRNEPIWECLWTSSIAVSKISDYVATRFSIWRPRIAMDTEHVKILRHHTTSHLSRATHYSSISYTYLKTSTIAQVSASRWKDIKQALTKLRLGGMTASLSDLLIQSFSISGRPGFLGIAVLEFPGCCSIFLLHVQDYCTCIHSLIVRTSSIIM